MHRSRSGIKSNNTHHESASRLIISGFFPLLHFPEEILIEILKRCFARDVLNVRRVCRKLYWITQERQLWRDLLCQLYYARSVRPPPKSHLSQIKTKEIEFMARAPLQLEHSWTRCTNWDAPKANVTAISRVRTHEHKEHDAGIWTLVPGGRWLFHMFELEDHPAVMVRMLDVDAAFDDVIELVDSCLAPPIGDQARVGPYTMHPNVKGDGMLFVTTVTTPVGPWSVTVNEVKYPQWTPLRPLQELDEIYDEIDTIRPLYPPAHFRERNSFPIPVRPLEVLIDPSRYVAIVFKGTHGGVGVIFWMWHQVRAKGQPFATASMITNIPHTPNTSFSCVNGCFVITDPEAQLVWGFYSPHHSRPDLITEPHFIQRFGGLGGVNIKTPNLRYANMWGASEFDHLLFATTDKPINAEKVYQYWMDKRTMAISAIVHPIPTEVILPEFREFGIKLLSCHVGETHNTMILATAGGLYAMRRLNPKEHRQQSFGYTSNIIPMSPLYTKEMFGVANSDDIIRNWENRHELLASFDEVTGRVAVGMFDTFPGTLTMIDFTKDFDTTIREPLNIHLW